MLVSFSFPLHHNLHSTAYPTPFLQAFASADGSLDLEKSGFQEHELSTLQEPFCRLCACVVCVKLGEIDCFCIKDLYNQCLRHGNIHAIQNCRFNRLVQQSNTINRLVQQSNIYTMSLLL